MGCAKLFHFFRGSVVTDNHQVLGTSAEPYASKPLRRERLTRNMTDVRAMHEWNSLVELFEALDAASEKEISEIFQRVLRSIVRRLATQTFSYPIPQRISMAQLETILKDFLSVSSGGLRPLAVTSALFKTIGQAFSIFTRVEAQGINEADAASGMPGDIICYDANEIRLVVEVKDIDLTLMHVQASNLKAKQSGERLGSLLFVTPGISERDETDIAELQKREFAAGLNNYTITLHQLSHAVFVLLDECWKVRFLREIGNELDQRNEPQARKGWHDVLKERL